MLFACWFMQRENISEMRSFSWVCMIHPGLFDLVKSLWFTERGTKSATLMWGRNAIHSAHYRKQMLHLNGVLMPTQSVVAESQLIWAASLGGEKRGALYLDEARIDSLQWVSKPTWLWPTSLHKLWVYIGAEHNACGAEIVGFFCPSSLCYKAVHLRARSSFPQILCIPAPLSGLTLAFMCGWLGCLSRIVFVFP